MRLASLLRLASPLVLFVVPACSGATAGGYDEVKDIGLGGECGDRMTCRTGLSCVGNVCAAAGTTADGAPCTIGAECVSGVCGPRVGAAGATCTASAGGAEGASCAGDADCGKGLRCGFDGTSFFPKCVKEGTRDVFADCAKSSECLQGLVCTGNRCVTPVLPEAPAHGTPPYIPGPTAWAGATCPENVKGDITALFQIPRTGDAPHTDFYRLPFPNDAARNTTTGRVSFANHPHDPNPPMGFDALKPYLDALEPEPFGAFPSVFFRFDGDFDFETVQVGGDDPQTRLVDLTTGADFGRRLGLSIFLTNGRNRYICQNYVVVHPGRGGPLTPGHTYAAIMRKGPTSCPTRDKTSGKCSGGTLAKQHADFTAMLAASKPSDAALDGAWERYKPLRDWLTKEGKKADDLLVASVFTVGDPGRVASRLRASVRAAAAPKAEGWVKCAEGVKSPCPQGDASEKRACGTGDSDFDEYHALVDLPIFQGGTAPYLKEGGAIASTGGPTEAIAPVRTDKVCMAVTVPKGTPPAGGWPIAIYAHGTGGSFRSHILDGSARILSKIDLGGGATAGFAVVGIDQVQHGPRRGDSKLSPDDLFFNFVNPAAARFNAQQGAADQHALVRLAESLSIVDGGATIKLDPTNLVYWGHSQGATEGAIFLASDTSVKGAVLSGQGATLMDSLTTKTAPVNIKDAMWIALSESGPKTVDANHPVLGLLQWWAEPSDPLIYARSTVVVPGATTPTLLRNVLQPMGKGDTFSPEWVQENFAIAAGLAFVGPKVFGGFTGELASAQGNVSAGSMKATAAFRQYAPPSGRDGHFVAFDDAQARIDVARFLLRSSRGETPKLPE